MRTLFTAVLIATLSIALMEAPVLAAPASSPSAPLGVVVSADNANVGAGVTTSGATIYDGDRLQTPANSTLRVRFGSAQMVLRQNTLADVHAFPKGFSTNLSEGTVVVSSAEGQTFEVLTDGATIRPANALPTSGQVSRISATEVVLTSTRGTLQVSMGDEVKTLEAGSSYRMEIETEDPGPYPNPQNPHATARNRFLWIAIPIAAAVTGIVIWRALVSPAAP
jgi:ferric-dicitrate binding protein FerR (iron transport regulator)